eukprot:scaffold45186_cov33-Prasinocladus_malaysianus.AAC.3
MPKAASFSIDNVSGQEKESRTDWKGGRARLAMPNLIWSLSLQGVWRSSEARQLSDRPSMALHVAPELGMPLETQRNCETKLVNHLTRSELRFVPDSSVQLPAEISPVTPTSSLP